MDVDDLCDLVVEACGADAVDEAVGLVLKAFWQNSDTAAQVRAHLGLVGRALAARGDGRAAALCARLSGGLRDRLAQGRDVSPHWFVAEVVRVTGWVPAPSVDRHATAYLARRELRGRLAMAVFDAGLGTRRECSVGRRADAA